ncbi:hypothetical protein COCVIDRAFT_21621 [Bipolaris victoriae FI3]|uniref:AMP-dependent synthetase/ligase domain-containing protein n=1 Tax=Bipolaris victoriae (strain FI3) TaxID=930091 RepID=W7FBN8_BIPV3|nr:hypothetical protein COCVIDRAFT_21621 [Bipolaris victoriae FI3]
MTAPRRLWDHPNPQTTWMWRFKQSLEDATGLKFPVYEDLHNYSVTDRSDFWRFTFSFLSLVYEGPIPSVVVTETARIDSIPEWFSGVHLNWAENVLFAGNEAGKPVYSPGKEDGKIAILEVKEGMTQQVRPVTWQELRTRVGRLSQAMRARGVHKGDRIAVVANNSVDTLTVFLATTSIGGIFSSISTDVGARGILERLSQIRPKYVFVDDRALYNRKEIDLRPVMQQICQGLREFTEFQGVVALVRFPDRPADIAAIAKSYKLADFLSVATSDTLIFERCRFSDPFLIVYSSGTTGKPKCIVHCIGGVLLNGCKESRLHRSIDHTSVHLQYTTTGWIMYLVSVLSLVLGAKIVMYDGSPFVPDPANLIRLASSTGVTHLGISPRFLQTLRENNISPRKVADLSRLQTLSSTGMVLSDSLFEWVYDEAFPSTIHLDNSSGGTDLAGAFTAGNPLLPLYVGGCQSKALGLAVEVFEAGQNTDGSIQKGNSLPIGQAGELVCTAPFPSMPVNFWGSGGPRRYFESYFSQFDNVWTHGDFVMVHPTTKQIIFLGRADGVLNPSGIRFGSAEIYGVIEASFADQIADCVCVGQKRVQDTDEKVILFLLLRPGHIFTNKLVDEIKSAIRRQLSPRHVPQFVFETPEIPVTFNGKKVELPVKQIVSGNSITPSRAIANPKCLDYYYQFSKDDVLHAASQPSAKL